MCTSICPHIYKFSCVNDMIFTHFSLWFLQSSFFLNFFFLYVPCLLHCSIHDIYTIVCVCFVYPNVLCMCVWDYCMCVFVRVYGSFSKSLVMFACLLVSSCCPLYPQTHHTLSEGWLWTNMHACGSVYACMWDSCVCTYACVIVNLSAFVYMCISLCLCMCIIYVCLGVCLHASMI